MNFLNLVVIFIYYLLTTLYLEITLKLFIKTPITFNSFIINLYTSILFSLTLTLFSTCFKQKTNKILTSICLFLNSFIFTSQFIYYRIFKTFYTLYSAKNGSQVIEFWKDTLIITLSNIHYVFLMFIPFFLFLILAKQFNHLPKIKYTYSLSILFTLLLLNTVFIKYSILNQRKKVIVPSYDSATVTYQNSGLLYTTINDIIKLSFNLEVNSKAIDISTQAKNIQINKETTNPKEYNVLNIDFDKLMQQGKDETIKTIHNYFKNATPTEKNKYTGKFKDYNLIFITAESFSQYAIRQDLTPTLYKLVHEGYNFTNFYNPIWGVSTTDGEYVACTGLIPKSGVWSFKESSKNYLPFVMGNQFKKLGYKTLAYHNHTYTYYKRNLSHPNMGYTYKGLGNGLNVKKTWPESDLEMMQKTIPEYINEPNFHVYYMTVSGHMRYSFTGNQISSKNKKYVENLNLSDEAKAYLATQIELDKAMEYLIKKLDEANILDKTLIVISADHYPYGLQKETIDELAGHTVEENFELYKSSLIIYTKNMKKETINKPCSSLDIIPTISNLLGLEYDSRLLMGKDIFSNLEPLVIFQNKSFITDKCMYNSTKDIFIPNSNAKVDQDYIKLIQKIVDNKFYLSAKILETNYYKKVFP